MSAQDFVEGLRALGHDVRQVSDNLIEFDFPVLVGRCAGEVVRLAFAVPADFPLQPPSGPMVSPALLPLHPDQSIGHPLGGVHPAPQLGEGWEYWSRPFVDWHLTDRSVRTYMAHIRHLFATL